MRSLTCMIILMQTYISENCGHELSTHSVGIYLEHESSFLFERSEEKLAAYFFTKAPPCYIYQAFCVEVIFGRGISFACHRSRAVPTVTALYLTKNMPLIIAVYNA